MLISPEEPSLLVPVIIDTCPETPALPASAVEITTAPLVVCILPPDLIFILPPVNSSNVVPAINLIAPPSPQPPAPIASVILPALCLCESPVSICMWPLMPSLAVPEKMPIAPLTPFAPELADFMCTFPLEPSLLYPLSTKTSPPVPAIASPALMRISPPLSSGEPPDDLPPTIETFPPFPPSLLSLLNPEPATIFMSPPCDRGASVSPACIKMFPPSSCVPVPTVI